MSFHLFCPVMNSPVSFEKEHGEQFYRALELIRHHQVGFGTITTWSCRQNQWQMKPPHHASKKGKPIISIFQSFPILKIVYQK